MNNLPEINAFGDSNDLEGSRKAVEYLRTNVYTPSDLDKHDMLYDAVNNFDDLCDTYDINE